MAPIHLVYFGMLLLGMNKDFGAYCTYHTYPYIFVFQYSIFFLTYIFYRFHHYNNHFIIWDEKALGPENIADIIELNRSDHLDKDSMIKTQARILFT